jgi:hypothetical protein
MGEDEKRGAALPDSFSYDSKTIHHSDARQIKTAISHLLLSTNLFFI